jgi:Transglutaminase-like superfamily
MLWGATVGLVRGAERTAERQLRAYISVGPGGEIKQRQRYVFEFRPIIRNNGLTPANNVRVVSLMDVVAPAIPKGFNYSIPFNASLPLSSVTTIGPRQERFHSRIMPRRLSISELRDVLRGSRCFHIWGIDTRIFFVRPSRQQTNFSFIVFVTGRRGVTRVQAICDFVHSHIAFGYEHARPTMTAWEVFNERKDVCRNYWHLAITFCRCMNIPARYCTDYLGDIGMSPPYAARG